ncbi:QsdR family transcriptional regulator [Pseudonocardia sp. NPDC046786]|uniref:QsdR family transcriptional regulator n=1 Tax=Pseudonocardia sp. NPDC046786 TaxID=3155471 RepID=UPI0033C8A21C
MSGPARAEEPVRGADAGRAFRVARRRFVAGVRIDMGDLAAELGVDRSTLFRWLGNRDRLVAAILMSLTGPAVAAADARADRAGGARIALTAGHYAQALIDSSFFQVYLRRESDRALRLLTSKASPVQAHVVGIFERMISQERDRGNLEHALDPHDLAYLVVRIVESFVYADTITGDAPDATKVRASVAALLHAQV